jgi:hypothetical protein
VKILCVAAPPSDQDSNSYHFPPAVCTGATPIERVAFSTPVNVCPAGTVSPSSSSVRPGTLVLSVTFDFSGVTSTNELCAAPRLSRTVSVTR